MNTSTVESADLAAQLKAATGSLHRQVERSRLMARLLRRDLPRQNYLQLMHNLQAIYAALEPALSRHAADPALAPVLLPGMFRAEALAADLALLSPGDTPTSPLVPATGRYVERLHELDRDAPGLLVAHAYVRYLGDLNGGQALQRLVARAYGLEEGAGTRFYDFGTRATQQLMLRGFRIGLGAIGRQSAQAQAIVAEAVSAFECHAEIFDELDAQL